MKVWLQVEQCIGTEIIEFDVKLLKFFKIRHNYFKATFKNILKCQFFLSLRQLTEIAGRQLWLKHFSRWGIMLGIMMIGIMDAELKP